MKKILFSFSFLVLSIFVCAQIPTFTWAKAFKGSADALYGHSLVLNSAGDVFSTGTFRGTADFDPGAGVFNMISGTSGSKISIYVSKLNTLGNFVWAKKIGGTQDCFGYSLDLDTSGNVYVTGYFTGVVDFDPGPGVHNITSGGTNLNIFVLKLDSAGDFVWAKPMIGTNPSKGFALEVGPSGNVYTAGAFSGIVDFNPDSVATFNLSTAGFQDVYVQKLDSAGNFRWAKRMGGSNVDEAYSLVLDAAENVYTTGTFLGVANFGITLVSSVSGSNRSGFISKLDSAGNYVFAKAIGGSTTIATAESNSITVDSYGNIYTTGTYRGTVDFDPNATSYTNTSVSNGGELYVLKLTPTGSFIWVKCMSGVSSSISRAYGITLDTDRNIYTTGGFEDSVDFDPGPGLFHLTSAGTFNGDAYLTKFDSVGNFLWAGKMGAAGDEWGIDILVDGANNIYTTGTYSGATSVDFDPGLGVFNLAVAGAQNVFIQKLGQSPLTSSLQMDDLSGDMLIYPNPTNGTFNVFTSDQIKNGNIEIYNTIGELVYSQKIINQQNTIDLKNQGSGLYFVKVISDGEVVGMKKVVKE